MPAGNGGPKGLLLAILRAAPQAVTPASRGLPVTSRRPTPSSVLNSDVPNVAAPARHIGRSTPRRMSATPIRDIESNGCRIIKLESSSLSMTGTNAHIARPIRKRTPLNGPSMESRRLGWLSRRHAINRRAAEQVHAIARAQTAMGCDSPRGRAIAMALNATIPRTMASTAWRERDMPGNRVQTENPAGIAETTWVYATGRTCCCLARLLLSDPGQSSQEPAAEGSGFGLSGSCGSALRDSGSGGSTGPGRRGISSAVPDRNSRKSARQSWAARKFRKRL